MPRLTPLAVLILAALPLAAQDPGGYEAYGFRRLAGTPVQNGLMTEIAIEGECSFPDDTSIDIFVEHRGQQCESLLITLSPKNGLFTGRMSTMNKMLPGHYVVKAQVTAARQEGDVLALLRNMPEKNATQAFSVGTQEEIKKIRDEHLAMYEKELAQIEATFAQLAQTYGELLKHYDMRESPLEWNRKFQTVPNDCQVNIERLRTMFNGYVIPVFPLLHSWTIEGFATLSSLHSMLTDGLTIEITEMMSRKGTDRQYFLKKAQEQMANYLKGMRAQIALERKLELREALVADITELSRLYEETSNTFDQAKAVQTDAVAKAWEEFMRGKDGKGGWRADLKAITQRLGTYRGSDLEREYKELVDLLTGAPSTLEKLWDLYDKVMTKGKTYDEEEKEIRTALDDCYVHIYPVMEVLGFNREAFNRLMQRYQGATEEGAPEDPVAGSIADYVRQQVEKLDSNDPAVAAHAISVLMKFGEPARRILKDMLEKEHIENPKIVGLIVVSLGRMGEKSVIPRLVNMVQDGTDESLRVGAVMAIGNFGGSEMLAPLEKALAEDKSAAVRTAAANALPLIHDATAIPELIKAFMDSDQQVRAAAEHGAESLAKIDIHFDPGASEDQRKAAQKQAMEWWELNKEKLLNPEKGGGEGDGGGK